MPTRKMTKAALAADARMPTIPKEIIPVARHVRVLNTAGTQVSDTRTYLHPDHLGTPRMVTNASRQVIWRLDTDPFGDGTVSEDPDGNSVLEVMPLRFPGQYFDAEAGVAYNYFRDYDQGTGRYTQADPIGLDGGSRYNYVDGNPLLSKDDFGLFKICRRPLHILGSNVQFKIYPDSLNLGGNHAHGFYDDGSGDSTGFAPGGVSSYDEDRSEFQCSAENYDDDRMREAERKVAAREKYKAENYNGVLNNCHNYIDDLLHQYQSDQHPMTPGL